MTTRSADPAAAGLDVKALWQAREQIPLLASWLWEEWGRRAGYALAETEGWLSDLARAGRRQTGLVALRDAEPLGLALLVDHDLETRRDLSPWLSSLYVVPASRCLGIASRLVRGIEQAALEREVPILYLYTLHQERYYARLGWSLIETFQTANGKGAYLMCMRLLSEEGQGR